MDTQQIKDSLLNVRNKIQDIIDEPYLDKDTEKDLKILLENLDRIRKDAFTTEL